MGRAGWWEEGGPGRRDEARGEGEDLMRIRNNIPYSGLYRGVYIYTFIS